MTMKDRKLVNAIKTMVAFVLFIPFMLLFFPTLLLVTFFLRILAKILLWLGLKNISRKIHSGSAVGCRINEFLCEKCEFSFNNHKKTAVCPKCKKPSKYINDVLVCPVVPNDLVGRLNHWARGLLP
jgi:uncharacterized paraquat-inducible protein A